jgi:hypothetical protein
MQTTRRNRAPARVRLTKSKKFGAAQEETALRAWSGRSPQG